MRELELFLVGLLMAASVLPVDEEEGTDVGFNLWYLSWVPLNDMFDVQARHLKWLHVGPHWVYHA